MVMPDRYSIAGIVKAYRLMQSNLNNSDFRWVAKQNAWAGWSHPASAWFDWFNEKLTQKINRTLPSTGKGNRSQKRIKAAATCKWCGSLTGGLEFCDRQCAISYRS